MHNILFIVASSLEEIERLVLSMGTHASAVGPEELVDRLRRAAAELTKRYGGPITLSGPDEG